jgi:hypothetical protein
VESTILELAKATTTTATTTTTTPKKDEDSLLDFGGTMIYHKKWVRQPPISQAKHPSSNGAEAQAAQSASSTWYPINAENPSGSAWAALIRHILLDHKRSPGYCFDDVNLG